MFDGQSVASVSRELGIAEGLIHNWKKNIKAGNNLYEYAGSNPISRRDPMGMDWRPDVRDFIAQAREK